MRRRTSILLAAAALMAVGCSDTPTDPAGEGAPLFNAGKGPDKGMQLLSVLEIPESEAFEDYIPCANGGDGEIALVWGRYEFWGRTVETPSGNYKQHGEQRGWEMWRGVESGDLWQSRAFVNPTIFYNTRHSDGYTVLNEPAWAFYQNQRTGEVIRVKFLYQVMFDADFNIVRYEYKQNSCLSWNGQVP